MKQKNNALAHFVLIFTFKEDPPIEVTRFTLLSNL